MSLFKWRRKTPLAGAEKYEFGSCDRVSNNSVLGCAFILAIVELNLTLSFLLHGIDLGKEKH